VFLTIGNKKIFRFLGKKARGFALFSGLAQNMLFLSLENRGIGSKGRDGKDGKKIIRLDHNHFDPPFLRYPGLQFSRYGSSLFLAQVRYFFHLSNPLKIASTPGYFLTLKGTFPKFFFLTVLLEQVVILFHSF